VAFTPLFLWTVVDDNDINRKVLSRQLRAEQSWTLELSEATNGQEAVEAVVAGAPFHAVIMDIEMPELDGLQATQLIRAHELAHNLPRTPIIGLSGNARKVCFHASAAAAMQVRCH